MSAADDFRSAFSDASRRTSAFECWQRFVYMAAYEIAVAFGQDASPFEDIAKASRKASGGERESFAAMAASLVAMLDENPYQDAMGDMYMRLGIGNEAGGQFFTPFHLSKLLGELALPDDPGEVVTVAEPACGAGANCIALCAACAERGIDWQRRVLFECQDVSELTALMCYVQLSLIGAAAKVSVGDTLRMETRYTLRTPVMMVEPCWILGAIRGEW